jgi:hypothetical protein
MKKVLFTVVAGLLAGMTVIPARAADDADKMFTFNGEVRARYEYLNNYLDLTDNTGGSPVNDDQMGITPYRVMVGITGNFEKNVTAHVDLQYTGHFGDGFNPSKDNPFFLPVGPPVGQADAAYQFATQGMQLYQGYVDIGKIGGSDFGLRIGRAEHTYGTELFLGDNDYYNGQAFDGIRGMWQHGASDLNFFYYKISEENCFNCFTANGSGPGASADSNLWGATYDWKFKTWGTVGGYVLVSQDFGGDGPVFFPDSSVMTYGARWNRGMMTDDKLNMFDWNIEYAMQTGDLGEPFAFTPGVDISSWVGEGWFGFNFHAGQNTHGRVHIGTLMTSGQTSTSTKAEDFIPLYGDFHANNRFGDMDWVDQFGPHNITDYNIGYDHWFGDAHHVMIAYHMFADTESLPGQPEDQIGDEIDLKYGYMYSKNLGFEVTLGQASPNKDYWAFFGVPNTDTVQRATFMAKLGW